MSEMWGKIGNRVIMKDKLINLLKDALVGETESAYLADYLIAGGVTIQEWISVEDRLPEPNTMCLTYYKHSYCDDDDYSDIGVTYFYRESFSLGYSYKVTHWMPLPAPPKGE